MRTDELIEALAADTHTQVPPVTRTIVVAIALGTAVSASAFFALLGFRPGLAEALTSWRFDLKMAIVVLALVLALYDGLRLVNPVNHGVATLRSWAVPALLLTAVGVEMVATDPMSWSARLVGSNWWICLLAIPVLALAPLVAGLTAMRSGAPASAVSAGAAVGRLAAASAAVVYALHCADDSPLFVATWYTLATLIVIGAGALAGRVALRW